MIGRRSLRSRTLKYFWWLVFITAVFVAPNLLSLTNLVQRYYFTWLDTFVTCALLFGPATIIVALAGAMLLAQLETVAERRKLQELSAIPRALVFALFLTVWLRLLRELLKVNKIDLAPVETPFEIWGAVLIAPALFALFPAKLSPWVDKTTARLRIVSIVAILASLSLTLYAVLEPLNTGAAAPVTRNQPGSKSPNVIIIVLDALTSRDMSLYGYRLPTTPNLDRLAKSWTVFENANTSGTATVAIQPAILTGRYPYLSQWYRYGDLAWAGQGLLNLPQVLRSFGYETVYGMGGGWPPSRYHLHTGFDRILGGGYAELETQGSLLHTFPGHDFVNRTVWIPTIAQFLLSRRVVEFSDATTTVDEPMYATAANFFRDRARSGPTSPFFLYLHMNRPHAPLLANEFLGKFLPAEEGLADVGSQKGYLYRTYAPHEQPIIDRLRLRYDENILKADQQVGDLLETLRQAGLYDQSLIIVTADHGDSFSEGYQGYFSEFLTAAEHQIPLLVKFPGQTEGRRVSGVASTVDILPTVLDVVGASYPQGLVDGQSLLRGGQDPHRIVYVNRIELEATVDIRTVAAVSGNLKLVRRNGQELLFNLANDPEERVNLLGRVAADDLQKALDQFVRRAEFVRAGGNFAKAPALITNSAVTRVLNQP